MKSKNNQVGFNTAAGRKHGRGGRPTQAEPCCKMTIYIDTRGGPVNIYNCPPGGETAVPQPPDEAPPEFPSTGACVPLALGSKPKQSLQTKLNTLLKDNSVPNVLSAAFFQTLRRFQRGIEPANDLERAAYRVFRRASPQVMDVLSCSLQVFDNLPRSQKEKLYAPQLLDLGEAAIGPAQLVTLFVDELRDRAAVAVFGEDACASDQRPGKARLIVFGDDVGIPPTVGICRLNGLRTSAFRPRLSLGEYSQDELQQECTLEVVDGQAEQNCLTLTEPCPGNSVEGVCLRVPEVQQGDVVLLEGYNFYSIDTRVRLAAKAPGTVVRDVETNVCGDEETPVTEIVNGVEVTIADCRVHDQLTFQVPEDLPEGIYGITVIVPNTENLPGFDAEETSFPEQFIRVLPSATATFQIASEELFAKEETSPESFGSDEVGIRIVTFPFFTDQTFGNEVENKFRFGNVDTGDRRDMSRVLFQGGGIAGVSMAIIGYEIDSESAFEDQIESSLDVFVDYLKETWNLIKDQLGEGLAAIYKKFGIKGLLVALAIAVVVVAIEFFVALWAPADLLIEDAASFTVLDLAERTSINFPAPAVEEFTSPRDIEVKIEPVQKDVQYRERRIYISDDEDSEYQITLRYNRL